MSATEIFANQPFGTVTSGGTDTSSTTWTVSANPAAPFPAAATGVSQFHITDTNTTAASEIILVTNISGSTWTVVRGAEGTTPVVHEANFTITQVLTAGWLSGVNSGVNPVGNGGTGIVTAAAYALLAGGTASTTPFQQVSGLGTSGQVLTSQGAGSLPSWTSQTGLVNPMSALGDMISGGTAGTAVRLAGGTIASKKFLTQTGAGTVSAAPAWGTIASADVPTLNQNTTGTAGNVTGIVAVLNGGTGGTTATTFAVVTGGTASTTPFQQVSGVGTAGQALTSNGAGALPSWQQTFTGLMEPLASNVTHSASPYSGSAGTFIPVDTTGGNVTVTLPAAPPDKTIIGIKQVIQGGTFAVTYNTSGSDVFNKAGGGTTGTLAVLSQGVITQYAAAGTIWYIYADDLPLGQLDARYVAQSSLPLPVGSGGTGLGSLTTYGIVVGGTASTTAVQQIAAGTSGQVLTGNGAGTLPSFQAAAFISPMTTHGDMIYENAALAPAALSGNTTSTKNFLTSTGSGGTANTPAWGTIASADMPGGTTSAQGALQLDGTAADIASPGTQAAGSGTLAAIATHVHPLTGFYPADASPSFLEWNFDSASITTNTALTTSGNIYLMRINVRAPRSVTNVVTYFGAVGSTLTTSQNYAGLYSSAGSLIGTSADQTVNWNTGGTTGLQTLSVGGTFSVPTGFVWVALMFHGTTGPAFGRASSNQAASANIGYTASTARHAAATGGTVLPGTINTTNNALQAVEYWAAIS